MTQVNIAQASEQLRKFILQNYLFTDDETVLNNEDSFLDAGILDSMGILELVDFLDETFGVKVDGDELIPENLDSINNLTDYLRSKSVTA